MELSTCTSMRNQLQMLLNQKFMEQRGHSLQVRTKMIMALPENQTTKENMFYYHLPNTLPSSLLFYGHAEGKLSLKYKVIARLIEQSETLNSAIPHFIFAKKRFIVIKTPDVPELNRSITLEKAVNTFFFVKQGNSKVTLTFDKNVYQSNDIARVKCEVDNRSCEKALSKIKIQLRRTIEAKDNQGRCYFQKDVIQKAKFDGVKSGKFKELYLELNLIEDLTIMKMFIDYSVNIRKKTIVPEDLAIIQHLTTSYTCQLFTIKYELEIYFSHKGMTLGSGLPTAKYQIHIHGKDLGLQLGDNNTSGGCNQHTLQNQRISTQVGIPYQDLTNQQYAMGIPFDQNQMTQWHGQQTQFTNHLEFSEGTQSTTSQPTSMHPLSGQDNFMNALNQDQAIRERALKKQMELEGSQIIDQDPSKLAFEPRGHQLNSLQNQDYPTTQANQFNSKQTGLLDDQQEDINLLYPPLEINSNYQNPQDKH
eukprot:403377367